MEKKKDSLNILHIVKLFLYHWLLIGASVLFFVILGALFYKFSSKTFSVYAKISLKTENQNRVRGDNTYVNVSDLMTEEKNLSKEIAYLTSTPLLKEVVDNLNLFTTYYTQENKIPKELFFSLINIYKESPFIVVLDKESPQPLNTLFYINIINDTQFAINSFSPNAYIYDFSDEKVSETGSYFHIDGVYDFGDTITNHLCSFKVLLNSNYNTEQFQGKDLFFMFNSPWHLATRFQKSLHVDASVYQSSLAGLTLEWDNYQLAVDLLNSLIDTYIDKKLIEKNATAYNTIEYIDRQLSNIAGSLGESEQQLQNFRTSRDLVDIDQKSSDITVQLRGLKSNRSELEVQYQNLVRLKGYFDLYKDSSTFVVPSYMGMSDETLATLIQELTNLSSERQNLISTKQFRNPRIKTLDANIATIKKVITDNIVFNISTAKDELDNVNARIDELDRELSRLPQAQRQLVGLERSFNLNDAVYTSLLERRIQAQIIMASNTSDCEIIEPVQFVEVASPSLFKILAITLFLGLFFPTLWIVFKYLLSPRIVTIEDLNRLSKFPVIGIVPHKERKTDEIFLETDPTSIISETIYSIRSTLNYYMLGERGKSILVTSSLPNEGKSFFALNLALSFSKTSKKTLLLFFDLRKNNQSLKLLNDPQDIGLSTYLINESELKDIVFETQFSNLDVVPNGPIPPNPSTLISSPKIELLFKELKQKYDYIIIDTPPYGLVSDAFILMAHSDINVYLSRIGVITRSAYKQSIADMQDKSIENVYHVFNDIKKIDRAYYGKYAYHYLDERRGLFNFLRRKKKRKRVSSEESKL